MSNRNELIQRLADMVGFDTETHAWVVEPMFLYEINPNLPSLLAEFFGEENAA